MELSQLRETIELRNEIAELKKLIVELINRPVCSSIPDYYSYHRSITEKITPENMKRGSETFAKLKEICSTIDKSEN